MDFDFDRQQSSMSYIITIWVIVLLFSMVTMISDASAATPSELPPDPNLAMPSSTLSSVSDQEIGDFVRFSEGMESILIKALRGPRFPSNEEPVPSLIQDEGQD